MTPERWKRTEELYHAACTRPPAERPAFLLEACLGDEALRSEVESLLNEPSADGFLAEPALVALARRPGDSALPTMTGRTLKGYHLERLLGAGGMGEVYRARDADLGRDVAIKILPPAFTSDPDRLARFEREARMLAALNHPNICGIYGVDEAEGRRFLVLELVEGETLARKLAGRAAAHPGNPGLPRAEALGLARQIADALEAAHDRGIIHRDLKPANINVTPDGVVKLLDFGLAKIVAGGGASPNLTHLPVGTDGGPRGGAVLGTAAYMSPEQARGLPVDKRTDIWAFGCVLYEMLAGRSAFAGETVSDTIVQILEHEPDWSALPAATPPSIRQLLGRCLTKDPRQRLRDIGEARFAIDGMTDVPAGSAEPDDMTGSPPRSASRLPWIAGIVLAAALAGGAGWYLRPAPPLTPARFSETLSPGQTLNGGRGAHIVAVSPDGAYLVYSGAPYGLYLRSMLATGFQVIPDTESYEASAPVFSPDSRSLAFFAVADQALKRIAVTGGAAQTLCQLASIPMGMTWGPEGIVFGQGSGGIMRVSPDGGAPETLVHVLPTEAAHGPQILPGGEHILFTLASGTDPARWDRAQVVLQSLKTGERKLLIDGASDARYVPSGHLVYAIGGGLYAVGFDIRTLELHGERVPVVEGVRRAAGNSTGAAAFSVSDTGTLVYVPGPPGGGAARLDIGLMNRAGDVEPLNLQPGPYSQPRVSPDGARLAFEADDGKQAIVYTYEMSGSNLMQQLTFGGNSRLPVWVSNTRVAYQSDREGPPAVWWQSLDGPAERLTTPEAGTSHAPESWFNETLLYSVTRGSRVSLWTLSLDNPTPTPFGVESSAPTGATFSPDGRWVAYAVSEQGRVTLYVEAFPSMGVRYPLTAKASDTPKHPRWSRGSKTFELFYNPNVVSMQSVRVTTSPFAFGNAIAVPKRLYGGPPGSRTPYDTLPDGRLVGLITSGQREYVRGADNRIDVILNWFEQLVAQVPVR